MDYISAKSLSLMFPIGWSWLSKAVQTSLAVSLGWKHSIDRAFVAMIVFPLLFQHEA